MALQGNYLIIIAVLIFHLYYFCIANKYATAFTMSKKILVIGSNGQIGTELVIELKKLYGDLNVIAADIAESKDKPIEPFEKLNVLDISGFQKVIQKHGITEIYLLAALLSATAEKNIKYAWELNMEGLFNTLDMAKSYGIEKIFWPSSIAVFGPSTPKHNTPQYTIMDPTTVYGIGKLAGERWCEYYFLKYGLDIRSLRYPGLIGHKSIPGGGTTDYAVHIFYEALNKGIYECFLSEDTVLPMMYMPDAIRATINLMEAPKNNIKVRSSYNISGTSFSPKELVKEIRQYIPDFTCKYLPDNRQSIAESWPQSIDDSLARTDWKWKHEYDLSKMTIEMLTNIKKQSSASIHPLR